MDAPKPSLTTPIAVIIGSLIIGLTILISNGSLPFKTNIQGAKTTPTVISNKISPTLETKKPPATVTPQVTGIKTFSEKENAQICREDGKPLVYLFSTTWCSHCKWVAATFDKIAQEYNASQKAKVYHWEMDINDNTLTTEKETEVPQQDKAIYQEFNPEGSIPTFVIGCKYFRVGNGYERENDLVAEETEIRAAIEDVLK